MTDTNTDRELAAMRVPDEMHVQFSDDRTSIRRWARLPFDGALEYATDPQPEIVGSPICKIVSYNQAHEEAVEMGYPSLTEALEHLDELRTRPPEPVAASGKLAEAQAIIGGMLDLGMQEALVVRARSWLTEAEAQPWSILLRRPVPAGDEVVEAMARALCKVAQDNARRDTGDEALVASYGWRDWLPDARAALASLSTAPRAEADAARVEEREACAKVADEVWDEAALQIARCVGSSLKWREQAAIADRIRTSIRARTTLSDGASNVDRG